MKQKVKKIIGFIFGTKNIILFKLTLSSLIIGIIFFIFMYHVPPKSEQYFFFAFASDIFFVVWLVLMKGIDTTVKFSIELLRTIIFFTTFILSINFFRYYNGNYFILFAIPCCIILFLSLFYFVSIFSDILFFTKKLFRQFKEYFFGPIQSTTSNLQKIIENITAFLLAISGFTVAIKAIIEPIFKIISP